MKIGLKTTLGIAAMGLTVGCSELDRLRDTVNDVRGQVSNLQLAGVTPAADFRETGNIDFSVLPEDSDSGLVRFANLQQSGMKVEVKNDDGTYSECEHTGGEEVDAMEHSTITLLLDGSGSMELAYPPSDYGDVCVTCPHDPNRERILAARALVERVHDVSPTSEMSVAEFGPDPTPGYNVTRLHSDFVVDPLQISEALDAVGGNERVGTPLYDSLAEMIAETRDAAKTMEETIRTERGEDVPWEEIDPNGGTDVPEEDREVARYIVVLSDGEDNESVLHDVSSIIELANAAGVKVYAVGLGPASASSADPDLFEPGQTQAVRDLQKLARDTGGFYAAAKNPAQLRELYDGLGKALTEGYQVETYSCVPKPTQDTPKEDCEVPPVGSRIDGRVSFADELEIPWVTIAP